MGLPRGLVFLLLLLLLLYQLQGSDSSLMKLNGNGYEDVIVAIDPAMPEDEAIIEGIQVREGGLACVHALRSGKLNRSCKSSYGNL